MYKQLFTVINNKAAPCVIYVFYGSPFFGKHLHLHENLSSATFFFINTVISNQKIFTVHHFL
jgi:hypothetical protein